MADRYRGSKDVTNITEKPALSTTIIPETASENVFVDLRCDPRTRPVLPATEFSGSHKKKATSSFQITSVTVQGSRMGNDGGEDSADDLDESHTEDVSSDILDCSKTTDLENDPLSSDNSNANMEEFSLVGIVLPNKQSIPVKSFKTNEAPVNFSVPLSLGVSTDFDVEIGTNVANSGVTLVTTTTTSPPVVNAQVPTVNSLPEHWQHRFKVVKIVSSEPFKRGRWICMDFTDPPPIHNDHKLEAPESGLPNVDNTIIGNTTTNVIQQETADRSGAMTHIYEIPVVNQSAGLAVSVNANQPIAQPVYSIIVPVTTATTTSTVTLPTTVNISVAPNVANASVQNAASQTATAEAVPSQQQATQTPATISNVMPQTIPPVLQTPLVHPITNNLISQPNQVNIAPSIVPNVAISSAPCVNSNINITQNTASTVTTGSLPSTTAVPESSNLVSSHVTGQQSASDLISAAVRIAAPLVNPSPLSDVLPDTLGTKSLQEGDDPESAPSGTSTVAIDNKIEQAMDLVKSHLMFAVREEVDVLKEKITELVDRISQLELENGILRANASQETLSQLPSRGQVVQPSTGTIPPSAVHHMAPGQQAPLVNQTPQGQMPPPQTTS